MMYMRCFTKKFLNFYNGISEHLKNRFEYFMDVGTEIIRNNGIDLAMFYFGIGHAAILKEIISNIHSKIGIIIYSSLLALIYVSIYLKLNRTEYLDDPIYFRKIRLWPFNKYINVNFYGLLDGIIIGSIIFL